MNKEDLIQQRPVYSQEQIDQILLTPEGKATIITRKRPRLVKEPIYLLEDGEKVEFKDEDGKTILNEKGEIQYVVKDYVTKQVGWEGYDDVLPATETFTIDSGTGNLSLEASKFLVKTYWRYNYFLTYQSETNEDYSIYLHKLRNDSLAVLNGSKSFEAGTMKMVKTFINKTQSQEYIDSPSEQQQGFFSKLIGGKKPERKPPEQKAAFGAQS